MKFQQIIKLHRENNKKTNNYCSWLEKVTNFVFAPFSNLRSNTNSHLKILTKLDGQMVPWSIRPSRWIKNKTHHKTVFYLEKTVQNGTTSRMNPGHVMEYVRKLYEKCPDSSLDIIRNHVEYVRFCRFSGLHRFPQISSFFWEGPTNRAYIAI